MRSVPELLDEPVDHLVRMVAKRRSRPAIELRQEAWVLFPQPPLRTAECGELGPSSSSLTSRTLEGP